MVGITLAYGTGARDAVISAELVFIGHANTNFTRAGEPTLLWNHYTHLPSKRRTDGASLCKGLLTTINYDMLTFSTSMAHTAPSRSTIETVLSTVNGPLLLTSLCS